VGCLPCVSLHSDTNVSDGLGRGCSLAYTTGCLREQIRVCMARYVVIVWQNAPSVQNKRHRASNALLSVLWNSCWVHAGRARLCSMPCPRVPCPGATCPGVPCPSVPRHWPPHAHLPWPQPPCAQQCLRVHRGLAALLRARQAGSSAPRPPAHTSSCPGRVAEEQGGRITGCSILPLMP